MEGAAESGSGISRGAPTQETVKQKWISEGTLKMIKEKRLAFLRWQEDRRNVEKHKEYVDLCKKVKRAVRGDREKWVDETMQGIEEDMRRHRQGNFFTKMKQLTNSRVTPVDTILDETSQPLQKAEEAGTLEETLRGCTECVQYSCRRSTGWFGGPLPNG